MSPKDSDKIGTVYKDERKRLPGNIRNRIPDRTHGSHNHGRRDWRRKYNEKYRSYCRGEETVNTSPNP